MPPFACNAKGELLRFIAPSAGLTCQGLPEAFSRLPALQSLDLSGNSIADSTEHVAAVLGPLKDLRRLHLRGARLRGQPDCGLVQPKLQVGPWPCSLLLLLLLHFMLSRACSRDAAPPATTGSCHLQPCTGLSQQAST